MAEHPRDRERVSERSTTHVTERSSSTGIAFVVGGLVVAVLLVFWLFGGAFDGTDEAEISDTSVTVEQPEAVGTGTEAETEVILPETEGETELAPETEGQETEALEELPAEEPETAN